MSDLRTAMALCFAMLAANPRPALAEDAPAGRDNLLQLPVGDPARRDRQAALVLDGITDTARGDVITPRELARRLDGVGLLFIGENHTNTDFHEVQLATIRALRDAGREVLIGLEMFPYGMQDTLDGWIAGRYSETEFLAAARWYENWGHHWNYYRDILNYARENRLRLYGVNSPRDVVRRVRADGYDALTPEEATRFPPRLAPDSEEHRRMYRAAFPPGDTLHMDAKAMEGLYRAQTAWDATMGWNALVALRENGKRQAIMVVLMGAGHVTYGLGSERQIDPWYDGPIASLVPVPVRDSRSAPVSQVRASYASFLWGVPGEREPAWPELGLSLLGKLGKEPGQVIQVSSGSVAQRAGIRVGDVIVTINGTPLEPGTRLRELTAGLRWGDELRVGIRRNGTLLDLPVPVRRNPVAPR